MDCLCKTRTATSDWSAVYDAKKGFFKLNYNTIMCSRGCVKQKEVCTLTVCHISNDVKDLDPVASCCELFLTDSTCPDVRIHSEMIQVRQKILAD